MKILHCDPNTPIDPVADPGFEASEDKNKKNWPFGHKKS